MHLFISVLLVAAVPAGGFLPCRTDEDEKRKIELEKLQAEIEGALKAKQYAIMIKMAAKGMALDPANPAFPYAAATAHLALRENEEAVKALTKVIELEPTFSTAYDRRGDAYLKLGKFKEAIDDFDVYLKANPKFAPQHWRRGIALYYAGRFKDGVEQFELHRKVNAEDVENSVWHYLCNARANSPKQAREELIPVSKDARVPMKQVLELYADKLTPKDVLDAAENSRLKGEELTAARFYAHLYVAMFYESEGDAKKTLEHLTEAVEKYKIGHYMWDVAAVHLKLVKEKK